MTTQTKTYQTLETTLDAQGVFSIKLNRPEIKNAFNEVMIAELSHLFTQVVHDETIRVVTLEGAGDIFCAGGDLNWMKKSKELTLEQNHKDTLILTRMFQAMNECPKPLVGIVQGAAIGGGVGLVAVCDIVLADTKTVFSLSEVRLGIVPACIGPFVTAKIGASHSRALFISAERFRAPKAKEIGLVHEVFQTRSEMDEHLAKLLSNLLECGPLAMKTAKDLIFNLTWPEKRNALGQSGRQSGGQSSHQSGEDCITYVSSVLAELRVQPEAQEGIGAFLEKRKPKWIKNCD